MDFIKELLAAQTFVERPTLAKTSTARSQTMLWSSSIPIAERRTVGSVPRPSMYPASTNATRIIFLSSRTNPAALMTALRSTTPADPIDGGGGVTGAAASNGSSSYLSKAGRRSKFSPEAFKHLLVLNTKWAEANKARATVTVEDLEDEPVNSGNQTLIRDDQ